MIALEAAEKIGSGNGRVTYLHPQTPSLILKLEHTAVVGRRRWYERPPVIARSNLREIDGYSTMIRRIGRAEDFITRVHGWEATSEGPALLAENARHGLEDVIPLNGLFKSGDAVVYSLDDIAWARQRYAEIADIFSACRVYNHGLKPESVMIGRADGALTMRLFDFKSIVYRQLISPRFLPRGQHTVQMLTIRSVLSRFDRLLDAMDTRQAM